MAKAARGHGGRLGGRTGGRAGAATPGPTQRQLRVAEQARHLIAEELALGGIHDPRLEGVSITVAEVKMSRDLRHAQVFATELGRPLSPDSQAALAHAAPQLAGRLARAMHLKYAPRLRFVADETFAEAARMERLIAAEIAVLDRQGGADDDAPTGASDDG